MNRVKLLFFAALRERMGTRTLDLDLPAGLTVRGLKAKFLDEYPEMSESMKSVLIAVNREYASDETLIPLNAEIGLFPPVSGG